MQWQNGGHWDKVVIPTLVQKFGSGQLKQETRNKDYLIVQPARIQQPYTLLKYVKIDRSLIVTNNEK